MPGRNVSPGRWLDGIGAATADLLDREFDPSVGHLAAVLSGCVFAPSLLTFWFVNGVIDFSTAFVVGSLDGPVGLAVRLAAYVLVVPVFLLLRMTYYLLHPEHRRTVLAGACPQRTVLSLDWFTVGILATGLPIALQDLGPWVGSNAVYLLGLFALPRAVPGDRAKTAVKVGAVVGGTLLFVYARYGSGLAAGSAVPAPAAVLGPVATFRLGDPSVDVLVRTVNSVLLGPPIVAAFALAMNRLLTRPELRSIPLLRHTLPRRDPERVVLPSAAIGTLFYLAVVAVVAGRLVVLP